MLDGTCPSMSQFERSKCVSVEVSDCAKSKDKGPMTFGLLDRSSRRIEGSKGKRLAGRTPSMSFDDSESCSSFARLAALLANFAKLPEILLLDNQRL